MQSFAVIQWWSDMQWYTSQYSPSWPLEQRDTGPWRKSGEWRARGNERVTLLLQLMMWRTSSLPHKRTSTSTLGNQWVALLYIHHCVSDVWRPIWNLHWISDLVKLHAKWMTVSETLLLLQDVEQCIDGVQCSGDEWMIATQYMFCGILCTVRELVFQIQVQLLLEIGLLSFFSFPVHGSDDLRCDLWWIWYEDNKITRWSHSWSTKMGVGTVAVALFPLLVSHVQGHGRLIEPPSRSTMWR